MNLLLPVRDEVVRKNEARREKEAVSVSRKKTKLRELILSAKVIKDKMMESSGMTKVKTRVIIKNI